MVRIITERADVIPQLGEVFRRYGYDGASLSRISEYTKLGKGSLYHFFPGGKTEMAEAVLYDIQNWFEAQVFEPLRTRSDIDQMFTAITDYFRSGQRICLMGAFAMGETRDHFHLMVKGYFRQWIEVLSFALCQAGVPARDAVRTAQTIVAGIQGALVVSQALDDERSFLAVMEDLRQLAAPSQTEKKKVA